MPFHHTAFNSTTSRERICNHCVGLICGKLTAHIISNSLTHNIVMPVISCQSRELCRQCYGCTACHRNCPNITSPPCDGIIASTIATTATHTSASKGSTLYQPEIATDSSNASASSTDYLTRNAVIAALGTVSVILLLTLMGVVMGWVWSCHRNKKR